MDSPFVGPAPLGKTDLLFGRDAEVEELHWRTVADRIVVLYSTSGAGKTSLLTAANGLLNELRERFHVSPILRFSGSTEKSLTMRLLKQLEADGFGLVQIEDSLITYFERLELPASTPPKRLLLVIDQFEELFTTSASGREQQAFFRQLGELLAREGSPVWLIASMREEYFSWLDQFRDLVPSRLSNTFRLNLLNTDQAIRAIRGPLKAAGVELKLDQTGMDASELIVHELSKTKVRTPEGKLELVPGTTVEPVQLQVICANLWRKLAKKGPVSAISPEDLENFRLDTALQEYCHEQLIRCATDKKRARIVRDWIDRKLLTQSGLRSAATVDPADPEAPTAEELRLLQEAHLVRRQSRQDDEWYELAHDSLTAPIRLSIETWRGEHFAVWQQLARSWHLGGERPSFYLTLSQESRASIPDDDSAACSDLEARFLEGHRNHRVQRSTWRNLRILASLVVLTVSAAAYLQWDSIRSRTRLLLTQNVTATQTGLHSILSSSPPVDLAGLAVVAGTELQNAHPGLVAIDFRNLLGDWLNRTRHIQSTESLGTGKSTYAWINGKYRLVAELGAERYLLRVADAGNGATIWEIPIEQVKQAHPKGVRAGLVLDDWIATGGSEGNIALWDPAGKKRVALLVPPDDDTGVHPLMRRPIRALARSGNVLYSGNEGGIVAAWALPRGSEAPTRPLWTYRQNSRVSSLGILTSPERLVSADISTDEQVMIIKPPASPNDKPTATALPAQPREDDSRGAFYSVAVSPTQKLVVAGNRAGKIHVWDSAGKHLQRIDAHTDAVSELRFLKDGRLLSAGWDGRLRLWTLPVDGKSAPTLVPILELPRQLISAALAPDETTVYVTTEIGDQLKVSLGNSHPLAREVFLGAHAAALQGTSGAVVYFAATPDAISTGKVSDDGPHGADLTRAPLDSAVALAWASERRALFAAQKDAVFVRRDPVRPFERLEGAKLDFEEIQSVVVDDDASVLMALTTTTRRPIRTQVKAWGFHPQGGGTTLCEVTFSTDFPIRGVRLIAFRPKSKEFVTSDNEGIAFWRLRSNPIGCPSVEPVMDRALPELPRGDVRALAFNPDGTALWVANYAGLIYSFSLGERVFTTWKGDAVSVPSAMAVSRLGAIAVGDENGKLYVIEPDRPLSLQVTQEFHRSAVKRLDISPDGRWLVSTGKEGVAVWDLSLETWKRRACALAKRGDFTEAEYQAFFKQVTDRLVSCAKK
ncbi:hypothetical protein [Variovorax sp. OV700]|uniref:nSTAND1 domain-containing NTPase n=1 Tax=Variovorax sp. OV700 TaxID=1882826 RepID=UPI00087F357C|nr:hypothetical protein [Variovorax sp. OV700]SDJ66649.1 WD40 repeat [Variovorax sp. OV700]